MAAPTGIAATLLVKGMTLHKLFDLPLDCDENATSRISQESKQAQVCFTHSFFSSTERLQFIRDLDAVLIDEMSMISRETLHVIESACRYLDPLHRFFGGKVSCRF